MINYKNVEVLLNADASGRYQQEWQNYIRSRREVYRNLVNEHLDSNMVSEANWILRSHYSSGEEMGLNIVPGDICYTDFGQAYLNETGYQHFGIVMAVCRRKALVIPMTSNPVQYAKAYDPQENPAGRKHLMRLGKIEPMNRPSVLFLNDMKFINTARVIDVKAHLDVRSVLFRRIQQRMLEVLFSREGWLDMPPGRTANGQTGEN